MGVKRYSMSHTAYIYDFLEAMQPETVFLDLPPDHPMFISMNSLHRLKHGPVSTYGMGFQRAWRKFIQIPKITAKFYVNSTPRYLS